ncbi:aminopeptidase [Brumimicrobium salinarum]|uniref:Aminopeptidase N n=1 Tax=Brumimicrobium salinarum TaxID=2058658 RepID=A0A2I0R3R5_9FLAO|nr:M1 family metallopeptidase [Brumimicrobium salinarum]PKR81189.1 aminopeptidase [Brumimicrobium salinarum]
MHIKLLFILSFAMLFSCNTGDKKTQKEAQSNQSKDVTIKNHSYGNIDKIRTAHLHLELNVDFQNQILAGVARHKMINEGANRAIFDIKDLKIDSITLGAEGNEVSANYEVGKRDSLLGSPLIVELTKNDRFVNIYYETTKNSEALDWLAPELTGSKKHPFLYTQGQAILTRTWIPVQDSPENRFTYSADLKVPSDLMALMSATNPTVKNDDGLYSFQMKQPIPSYLLALAVGELEYAQLGPKSGAYAEPHMIAAAEKEFKDIPQMIEAAQKIYGDYLWDVYDVIVLPYSFPFGGMENPRLTFATPTLIAGDGSLVSVIAHELAHSWSGNLVTNASWNDFWLNEGFTVYFENRIMEAVYGKEIADMLALIEFQELESSVNEMMSSGREKDTHLKLELQERDPDEGMTDIAYVKGAFFLKTIESKVGRETFDQFLSSYFNAYQFETLTTEEFVSYLKSNLLEKENVDFNVDAWVYGEGIPDNVVKIKSDRFEKAEKLAIEIKNEDELPAEFTSLSRDDKITQEWIAFIRAFEGKLAKEKMIKIDEQLNFADCGNAEIMSEWYILGIKNNYTEIRPEIKAFLKKVGRRKFLAPIYTTLASTDETLKWGKEVYKEARPYYHAISYKTVDEILGVKY